MFSSIQRKTLILLFTVFTLFLSVHVFSELKEIKSRSFETLNRMNTALNSVVSEYASAYVYNKDIENIQRTVDAIESEYVKSIYILDKDANIIVETKKPISDKIRHPKFDKLLTSESRAIKTTQEYLILNTFDILDIPIGYMILEADLQTYNAHIDEEIDELMLDASLWLLTSFILSWLIAKSFNRPIFEILDKLKGTKDNELLEFSYQPQKEFKYLCENIAKTHNRLRVSNENLEVKVKEKTLELQELNRLLESRVEEEVEKNRLQTQQMLEQSRLAQMGEMISMIAHQWRQPLGAISATSVNLQMSIELEEFDLETKEGVEKSNKYFLKRLGRIDEFVHNLTTTIDDFRNFYKPNKVSVSIKLDEIVLKALSVIKASLKNDNVEIIEHNNSKEMLEIYDSEMMQVILNILKNAQDNFREKEIENPKITINTNNESIVICDNGGGITEDILEKIFDPYFSTKDEKNGTGLGLYMSKTIVEEHHGCKLKAINKDNGICFTIDLSNRRKLNEK